MDEERVIVELELEASAAGDATAPAGWLRTPAQPARRFESYVELIGALEELRQAARNRVGRP